MTHWWDYVLGAVCGLVALTIFGSLIYGYSQPDPSSWAMDPEEMAEYDRRAEEAHRNGRA